MYQPNPPKRKPKKNTSPVGGSVAIRKATQAASVADRSSAERANVGAGRKRMREQNAASAKQRAEYMSTQAGKGRMGVKGGFGMTPGTAAGKAEGARRAAARKDQAATKARNAAGVYRNTVAAGGFGQTTGEAARKTSAAAAVKAGKGRMAGNAAIAKAKAQNKKDLQALPSPRTVRENFVNWRKSPIAAAQKAKVDSEQRAKSKATAARKAAGAAKGAKIAAAMDKRASSFKGADVRAANNTIRRANQSAYPKGKTLPKTK